MKIGVPRHPKTLDFVSRLGVKKPTALGHLELFWAYVAEFTPQGNIGKLHDGSIALGCEWEGEPKVFVDALIESGFLDRDETHRLIVHDWEDHAPSWVRAKLSRAGKTFLKASVPTIEQTIEASPRAPVPRHATPRHATPRVIDAARPCLDALKAVYPKRAGGQPWNKAERAIAARLREGASEAEILDGASRYATFVKQTGIEGTAYVMQAATFCGPDKHFLETWNPPPTAAEKRQDQNIQAGKDWLEGKHASF